METMKSSISLNKFLNYLRMGDEADVINTQDKKEKAIDCYHRALFGDEEGFDGFFIESIFKTFETKVLAYTRHYYDFSKISNMLVALNERIDTLIDDDLIHIYELTKIIDTALEYQFSDLIESLVDKVDDTIWKKFTESAISDATTGSDDIPNTTYYKLGMRVNRHRYVHAQTDSERNHYRNEFIRCIDKSSFKLQNKKAEDLKRLDITLETKDKKALPFCNIISDWISSEQNDITNFRTAIPHLYKAIRIAWDNIGDAKYDARSFIFKSVSNVQLKRITDRILNKDLAKANEYTYTLFENLLGYTPEEEGQRMLHEIYENADRYSDRKNMLRQVFLDLMFGVDIYDINDETNRHRDYFFKDLAEFCRATIPHIRKTSKTLFDVMKGIFVALADTVYDKYNYKKGDTFGYTMYFEAYSCAVVFFTFDYPYKAKDALVFAKSIAEKNIKGKQELLLKIEILDMELGVRKPSNLDDEIRKHSCEKGKAIARIIDNETSRQELNRQAMYDVAQLLTADDWNPADGNQAQLMQQIQYELSKTSYGKWLMYQVMPKLSLKDNFEKTIFDFLLSNGALLEIGFKESASTKSAIKDKRHLTLCVLQLISNVKTHNLTGTENLYKTIATAFQDKFTDYKILQDNDSDYSRILQRMEKCAIDNDDKILIRTLLSEELNWRSN